MDEKMLRVTMGYKRGGPTITNFSWGKQPLTDEEVNQGTREFCDHSGCDQYLEPDEDVDTEANGWVEISTDIGTVTVCPLHASECLGGLGLDGGYLDTWMKREVRAEKLLPKAADPKVIVIGRFDDDRRLIGTMVMLTGVRRASANGWISAGGRVLTNAIPRDFEVILLDIFYGDMGWRRLRSEFAELLPLEMM